MIFKIRVNRLSKNLLERVNYVISLLHEYFNVFVPLLADFLGHRVAWIPHVGDG